MRHVKLLCCLVAFLMMLGLLASYSQAEAASGNDLCSQYSKRMVEDAYRYLDEFYITKYPQLGLRWLYGTEEDRAVLQKLSDIITEGCTTDRQKVDAIVGWVHRNIEFVYAASPYPIDTFYTREGNCLSFAQLIVALARLNGIPAAFGDGFRVTTSITTIQQTESIDGHAWAFVHVDGQWLLFDPLWEGTQPVTDRAYIAENYMMETVEQIMPVYDADYYPPHSALSEFVYLEGELYLYHGGKPTDISSSGILLNGHDFSVVTMNSDEPQYSSYQYLEDKDRIMSMKKGQILHGGWLGWSEDEIRGYAYENGILASSTVMERNGKDYYLISQNAFEIHIPSGHYRVIYGQFSVPIGYHGMILEPMVADTVNNGQKVYAVWTAENPDVATVDQNGVITNHKEGGAGFRVNYYIEGDTSPGHLASIYFSLWFLNIERAADYSDNTHVCSYQWQTREATCTEEGVRELICSCGKIQSREPSPPLGHLYSEWRVVQMPTQSQPGTMERACDRCGHMEMKSIPAGESTEPPVTDPVQRPTEGSAPSVYPPIGSESPSVGDVTEAPGEDYLDPNQNGLDTLFITEDGIIVSVPRELLEGYEGIRLQANLMDGEISEMAAQLICDQAAYIDRSMVYDMSMVTSFGETVQPADFVIISVPMPEGWSAEQAQVYYVDLDYQFVEQAVSSVSEDGAYIRFVADHFSCYSLVQTAERPAESTVPSDHVDDSDPTHWVLLVIVAVMMAGIIVIIVCKRKKAA